MKFKNINYPVYPIRGHNFIKEDTNILYINTRNGIFIIDNKNLSGNTLGVRRLKITKESRYPLYNPIFSLIGFIRRKNSTHKYIDNFGKIITYNKSKLVPLTYHKIIKVELVENVGKIITLSTIPTKFTVSSKAILKNNYAGILNINNGYLLYEICEFKKKDTRRKI